MTNVDAMKLKLETLERTLKERGVVDVKFAWASNPESLEKMLTDVVEVLYAVVHGPSRPLSSLGDSYRNSL